MGSRFVFIGKCVTRATKAVGHAVWQHFQETGYIMAMGYLPSDETEDLVNPELREYEKDHA
jgi:hypothetical protein